jgi:hypothetical protein
MKVLLRKAVNNNMQLAQDLQHTQVVCAVTQPTSKPLKDVIRPVNDKLPGHVEP